MYAYRWIAENYEKTLKNSTKAKAILSNFPIFMLETVQWSIPGVYSSTSHGTFHWRLNEIWGFEKER